LKLLSFKAGLPNESNILQDTSLAKKCVITLTSLTLTTKILYYIDKFNNYYEERVILAWFTLTALTKKFNYIV
jgi:hypothetical protein